MIKALIDQATADCMLQDASKNARTTSDHGNQPQSQLKILDGTHGLHEFGVGGSNEQVLLRDMDSENHMDYDTSLTDHVQYDSSSVQLEHLREVLRVDPESCEIQGPVEMVEEQEVQTLNAAGSSDCRNASSEISRSPTSEVEEHNSLSDMDIGQAPSVRNDAQILHLEAELSEMKQHLDRIQTDRLETDKAREMAEAKALATQAELEMAQAASRELMAANQAKEEEQEKQKLLLKEALERLELQTRFLESGTPEAKTANESINLQRSYHDLKLKLAEKEGVLRDLRDSHDQLRSTHKRKEEILNQEKEEIINALEASEVRCEEQSLKLRERENDLARFKTQAANLEKRSSKAEMKASESSLIANELQGKLDATIMELFELKTSSSQVESMKLRLQETERALSHERSQRAIAENSWKELKHREEKLEDVEQGHKELQGRLKWRNEQFQSLEEAHSNLRLDFKEKKSEWDLERAEMLSEIDTLQSTLESKERLVQQVQNQLQMIHQALAHEESRRKVVELQAAGAREGLELATADCEAAQSAMEILREQTSTEIGSLRDILGAKDMQLKDIQVKYLHMEQEYGELKGMEREYRDWMSTHGDQQKLMADMKEKMANLVEAHDNLRARVKEQEKKFERERKEMSKALDLATDNLTAREQVVKQLDSELERLKGALEHVKLHRSELDTQLKETKEQLVGACEEAATAKQALTSLEKSTHAEKTMMLESLNGKDRIVQELKAQVFLLNQTIVELNTHEEKWREMQSECQALRQLLIQRDTERKEMERIHESLNVRRIEQEKAWSAEREKLVTDLQLFEKSASDKDQQLTEVVHTMERHRDVIMKLETKCASIDKEIAEHSMHAEKATKMLVLEKLEMEKVKKEAREKTESLSSALSHKETILTKLTDDIKELETELRQRAGELADQNAKVVLLETRVKETLDLHSNMQEHIAAMKAQAAQDAEEMKILEGARSSLDEELRKSQEEHLKMRRELEEKLVIVQREFSSSAMKLKTVSQQLEEERAQKELLLKHLDSKEISLANLMEEKKSLLVEKSAMHQAVQVLEAKKQELLGEVESSRNSINQLCNKVESVEARLASQCIEAKELQARVQNAHKVDNQLRHAEEQIKELEGYLQAAKAIAQDKEEKLAASEWAVQQLAMDVSKAKNAFHVKEREEALLRENLDDLERQLRGKEGELIEMECYLEEAAAARKSMELEAEMLQQRMADLDRGAAAWKKKETDMTTQLEEVEAALEEKRDALVASELEVKRGDDLRQVMEGAIASLKSQLAQEQGALSSRQADMNRLCEDLERTKDSANTSAELVKELQGRLQQLDQSSEERLTKFKSTVLDLQQELSVAHTQLEKFENQTQELKEDSSRYREKYESLLDLNGRKDCALKDMEAQLVGLQTSLEQQGDVLERRERELRLVKEQLQHQDERHASFQESFSRLQGQAAELELSNGSLEAKVRTLTNRLDNSSMVSSLKSEEIESLKTQVEELRLVTAQEGEYQAMLAKLSDDLQTSSHAVKDRESRIRVLNSSLEEAHVQLQTIDGVLASKGVDIDLLQEKLSLAGEKSEQNEVELTKLLEELGLAQRDLSAKSEIISSYVSMMNVLEVEAAEWKERAELGTLQVKSLKEELQATTSRTLESEQRVLQTKLNLEQAQSELNEKTSLTTQHLALIEDLQKQLREWKEQAVSASEEQNVFKAALAETELKANERDLMVADLQEALQRTETDASQLTSTVSDLQAELSGLRLRETAVSEEGLRLRKELELIQAKAEINQQEISELQEMLAMSEVEMKEKTERICYQVSLSKSMESELCEWKKTAAAAHAEATTLREQLEGAENRGEENSQQVVEMKEALKKLEEALTEEKNHVVLLTGVEQDLIEERIKVQESYGLLSGLQSVAEDWRSKAEAAVQEGERVKQELAGAFQNLSKSMAQIEGYKAKEISLCEQNQRLQAELAAAEKEVLARKKKMQGFLLQIEKSQKSERDLLAQLQLEHKVLTQEIETGGGGEGFDNGFELDAVHGSSQAMKRITRGLDNAAVKKFNESQDSVDDSPLVLASGALEKELVVLRIQAEESQHEAHKLAVRLDAALSNLATKNLIIKQVHDEISALRAVVKAFELEKLSLQDQNALRLKDSEAVDGQDVTCTVTSKPSNEEELNHYLELCDSLVRKNIRLEKQLDGLQRKNRGLQKQVEGLQVFDKNAGDKQRKPLDRVLSRSTSPESDQGFPRKVNVKPTLLERKGFLQDMSKGKVLGELDENACPANVDKLPIQMSRRPLFSPAAVQQKKARRVIDES